jgi:hypothetical protein
VNVAQGTARAQNAANLVVLVDQNGAFDYSTSISGGSFSGTLQDGIPQLTSGNSDLLHTHTHTAASPHDESLSVQ